MALFSKKEKQGFETRYNTWNECHNYFVMLHNKGKGYKDLTEEEQKLALLNLSFYLASWGMYRGSSFVLQFDNNIYEEVISILLSEKHSILWNLDVEKIKQNITTIKQKLVAIRKELNIALKDFRAFINSKSRFSNVSKKESNISKTLITKILLGTICCTPAYDQFFINSIGSKHNDFYDDNKIENLLTFITENSVFEDLQNQYKEYPLMKIVDIAYYTIGLEKGFKTYYENYIYNNQILNNPQELKKVVKSIRQFYYCLNKDSDYEIHVAFDCDKGVVEKFISSNLLEIKNILKHDLED